MNCQKINRIVTSELGLRKDEEISDIPLCRVHKRFFMAVLADLMFKYAGASIKIIGKVMDVSQSQAYRHLHNAEKIDDVKQLHLVLANNKINKKMICKK